MELPRSGKPVIAIAISAAVRSHPSVLILGRRHRPRNGAGSRRDFTFQRTSTSLTEMFFEAKSRIAARMCAPSTGAGNAPSSRATRVDFGKMLSSSSVSRPLIAVSKAKSG